MIVGFGWSGTLVNDWDYSVFPDVDDRLSQLPPETATFIATNQACSLFREIYRDRRYPSPEDVADRIYSSLHQLTYQFDLLLISTSPPDSFKADPIWDEAGKNAAIKIRQRYSWPIKTIVSDAASWRKPHPGMLSFAWDYFHDLMIPRPVVFVGDKGDDQQAAVRAGFDFVEGSDWLAGKFFRS